MAYKKVWKNGGVDFKAYASNAMKKAAVARKKAEREQERDRKQREREQERDRKKRESERERDRKKLAKEAESARKTRERESIQNAKRSAQASARSAESARKIKERESIQNAKRSAQASARSSARLAKDKENLVKEKEKANAAMHRVQALDTKERERKNKRILRLNGLFLEHEIPLKLFGIDSRELAFDFEEKQGISSATGFKKVTVPYLEQNLFQLLITMHVSQTCGKLYQYQLKKALSSAAVIEHPKIVRFKVKCKEHLRKLFPNNLKFSEFHNFKDPLNAEAIQEYIEDFVLPAVPEIKKEIENDRQIAKEKMELVAQQRAKAKQEREALEAQQRAEQEALEAQQRAEREALEALEAQQRAEREAKKELEDKCKKLMEDFTSTIAEAVKVGKTMQNEINKMNADLIALDASYNSSWFSKKKFALEAQGLAGIIWKRTSPLIDIILSTEGTLNTIKNMQKNLDQSGSPLKADDLNSKAYQALEENGDFAKTLERFNKLYLAMFTNLEMQLANLEKSVGYYEDDKKLEAIEKIKIKGKELSRDSANLNKLFTTFGG